MSYSTYRSARDRDLDTMGNRPALVLGPTVSLHVIGNAGQPDGSRPARSSRPATTPGHRRQHVA
jgi:hypothetical protein